MSLAERLNVWIKNKDNPFQIRETLRFILSSQEITLGWGSKVKSPFELMTSILRVTEADFTPNQSFDGADESDGIFTLPLAHAHRTSRRAEYWLSSNTLLARWKPRLWLIE